MKRWHHADLDNRMFCNLEDGKKIAMPRYYKDRIYTEHERKRVGIITRFKMITELNKIVGSKDYEATNPDYFAQKAVSDMHEFNIMYQESEIGRTKI